MKLTDLMVLLIIFGVGMSAVGHFILGAEREYSASNYTATYNTEQYRSLINDQGNLASDASNKARDSSTLSTDNSDPYQNIFIGGWNAIKDLIGIGGDINAVQAQLTSETEEAGISIPWYIWGALASIIVIIILGALVNATQRIDI